MTCWDRKSRNRLRPWPRKGQKLYMVSFGLSLLWIGSFAFLLVWWTEIALRRNWVKLSETEWNWVGFCVRKNTLFLVAGVWGRHVTIWFLVLAKGRFMLMPLFRTNICFLQNSFRGILRFYTAQVAAIIGVWASEWDFCSHWLQDMWKKCSQTWIKTELQNLFLWIPYRLWAVSTQIPTIISGLTFLAAATSIPDAVSSMAVARKGALPVFGGCGAATSMVNTGYS